MIETFTDQQATDEAVFLLTRKLRRLYPQAYTDLTAQLPQGACDALNSADYRADVLRAEDQRDQITRVYRGWDADEAEDATD